MTIQVQNETKKRFIESIKQYFAEELDHQIGDLKASLLLEFCLKEIGPTIYNDAISDAQAYFQDRVSDLDGTCYEPEFSYWKK